MKLYLLMGEYGTLGVFSSKEKAETAMKLHLQNNLDRFLEILDYDLDFMPEENIDLRTQ